jgi:hypothetical protein
MAIPFNLPDEVDDDPAPNTPSQPITTPHNNNNSHSPQLPQIDNEALVQAFYEALCRCSQGMCVKILCSESDSWKKKLAENSSEREAEEER